MHYFVSSIRRYRLLLIAIVLFSAVGFGLRIGRVDASEPTEQALAAAVNAYLHAQESPLADQVAVQITARDAAVARISVIPTDETIADPATAFLRLEGEQWTVLSIGTAFAPEDCAALDLPPSFPCE